MDRGQALFDMHATTCADRCSTALGGLMVSLACCFMPGIALAQEVAPESPPPLAAAPTTVPVATDAPAADAVAGAPEPATGSSPSPDTSFGAPLPAATPADVGASSPAPTTVQPAAAPSPPASSSAPEPAPVPLSVPPALTYRQPLTYGPRDRGVSASEDKEDTHRLPMLGAMLDVGVPDGVVLSAAFRPWSWVRLQAGGGSNAISPGIRAGLVLIPFGAGPSLTVEAGRYFEGDANGIVTQVAGNSARSAMAQRVGYDYANFHLGVELGGQRVTFLLHGGASYVRTELHDANQVFGDQTTDARGAPVTSFTITSDPVITAVVPSFKCGFLVYLV